MKRFTALTCIAIAVGVSIALAQTEPITPPSSNNSYGGGGWGGSYHSSTAAEGRLRGLGDVVRSTGQANLDNSAAAINYSVARKQEMSNRSQWTNTYFDMRRVNQAAREQDRGKRASMEDLIRFAQAGKPKQLSPSELDTITGTIQWPTLLSIDEFATQRAELEKVFARRASNSAIGYEDLAMVKKTTDAMLDELKDQVSKVSSSNYIAAKRFLQSIAYEAGQPVS